MKTSDLRHYHNLATNRCVECGRTNDMITQIEPDTLPDPDDVSICWYCGHVALFNADRTLREPTVDECLQLHQDHGIRHLLALRSIARRMEADRGDK